MTSPEPHDDLVDRVSALEQQQRADRRALGSLDADVSELQSQRHDVRLLQSLRDTQIQHGERLDHLESEVRSGFAAVGARLDVIVDLLRRDAR
jgi:peptidoglycan hydrolase CwlO-like protein